MKYCLAKMQSEFDINDSGSFPRSTSDRRLLWMFALDLSASSILPGESAAAAEQPGPKKRARTDRKDRKAVIRQYSALAAWAEERYVSLGSVLHDFHSKSWTEAAAWLQRVCVGFQDQSLVEACTVESWHQVQACRQYELDLEKRQVRHVRSGEVACIQDLGDAKWSLLKNYSTQDLWAGMSLVALPGHVFMAT